MRLLNNKDKIDSLGSGAIFKCINKTILSKLRIVLPPLPEQKKIAAGSKMKKKKYRAV